MNNYFAFDEIQNIFTSARLHAGLSQVDFRHAFVDSRKLKRDDVFVALVGHKLDGRDYISLAIENGAIAIFAEQNQLKEQVIKLCHEKNVTLISIQNIANKLNTLADYLYSVPQQQLTVVGVTGTNGKSSIVQMLGQALHLNDGCCWTLGTLGVGPFGTQKLNDNTTADALTVHREIARAYKNGCRNVAMEVSSHGLHQKRVASVHFDIAVFTNLTRDHLDYHGTMQAYGEAKRELFLMPSLSHVVLNVDDKFGKKLKKDAEIRAKKWFVSLQEPIEGADLSQWIWAENIRLSNSGIRANVYTPWGVGKLNAALIGRFNLYNLLSVITVLGIHTNDLSIVMTITNQLTSVIGRMQLIKEDNKPLIIVDYAHSPNALEQALFATREHCSGKIFTVFGCGGDRDPGKRPLMARIAERLSNRIIVTDDNPRTENAEAIFKDISEGFRDLSRVRYISNRRDAIAYAVGKATSEDVILIAGKGHENYQIVGDRVIDFSDVKVAREILQELAA